MRKYCLRFQILALAIITGLAVTSATNAAGVKEGNWIEYTVEITGSVHAGHDIDWARMDVTSVEGDVIVLDIQTRFSNGTVLPDKIVLNLATGVLGDDFIIPANLNVGDSFYDAYQGDITITGTEQGIVAGASRTMLSASTAETTYKWDRQTGVLVEGNSTFSEYSMVTRVSATNLWQPQILGLDLFLFFGIVVAVAAVVVLFVAVALLRKRAR